MSRIAVIYWSGTGNTRAMAEAVADGARWMGADVTLTPVSEVTAAQAAGFDALALGCPSMGCEVLEETEFEPFFTQLEGSLSGKPVALFGSYGWGDGQWMRDWQDRLAAAGGILSSGGGLAVQDSPDENRLTACRLLGETLAKNS